MNELIWEEIKGENVVEYYQAHGLFGFGYYVKSKPPEYYVQNNYPWRMHIYIPQMLPVHHIPLGFDCLTKEAGIKICEDHHKAMVLGIIYGKHPISIATPEMEMISKDTVKDYKERIRIFESFSRQLGEVAMKNDPIKIGVIISELDRFAKERIKND